MEEIVKRKEFFEALGHLVWSFAGLDFLIRHNLWLIKGISPSKARKEIDFRFSDVIKDAKKGALKRFEQFPELLNKIMTTLNKSEELNGKRNLIIHSSWWTDEQNIDKPYSAFRMDKRINNEFGGEWKDFTEKQIHEIAEEIIEVRLELFNLLPNMMEIVGIFPIEGVQKLK